MLVLLMPMGGCSSSEDAKLTLYIQKIKSRQAKPLKCILQLPFLSPFAYPQDQKGESPFKRRHDGSNKSPLSKQKVGHFSLNSLKFVGVLKGGGEFWALISQPDGGISKVKVGDYLGRRSAKVILINEHLIKVEVRLPMLGKWKKRFIKLNLQPANSLITETLTGA